MLGRVIGLGAVAALVLATAAQAADKCSLGKIAEFEVKMNGGLRPLVAAKLNGTDTQLMVDSGSFFNILGPSSFETFNLKRGQMPDWLRVRGAGGTAQFALGQVNSFEVGSLRMSSADFLVGGPAFGSGVAGLLGENVLGAADIEYDLANGVIRMFRPEGCGKANMAYWAAGKPVSALDLINLDSPISLLVSSAKVNGQQMRVMFDTGAPLSVIKRSTAEKAGFRPEGQGVVSGGVVGGIGRRQSESWIAPFASFAIGGEQVNNTRLRVAEISLDTVDMLLGADFFLSHRIYVSRGQRQIYFTYNGGPVFRLERQGGPAQQVATADIPTQAQGGPALDADDYSRRGAASAARRDYTSAIADFSKAVELAPTEPSNYFQRGIAHLSARQPVMGMADLDEAIKLKPTYVEALMSRGEIFLARGNLPRAQADFESASVAAGKTETVELRIGSAYLRAGMADKAINEYDAWLAAHPREQSTASVLNGRCYARGLGNKDLDKALADCNAAIRASSSNSAMLDSRGLVYLRMNQLDKAIADYDEAIKKQPRAANALYGRGLAKVRKGQVEDGRRDIAAAHALDPSLAQMARLYGLVEAPAPVNP